MRVYSFPRGGIPFEDPSAPTGDTAVTAFLPALSVIPLIQHTGSRATPVVSVGETVKEGMIIGRGNGYGSANVHASVPGTVIRMVSWKMGDGRNNEAILIRMEGSFDKLGRIEEPHSWESMLPSDIQRLIGEYGIVEMEAQGEPIFDIIATFRDAPEPVTLVVRCVFDDPWLAADYVLCNEYANAVVEGSRIMAKAVRAERIVYAFTNREKSLGEKLLALAQSHNPPSSLLLTGSKYPQKNKRELEYVLRNYARNEDFDPGSVLILGPATLAAVYDAIKMKKPILDRYVAVGGSAIKNPQVMKVRIGSRIGEVFEQCGGFTGKPVRMAVGSPLLGRAISDLDEPVMKTSFAVFAFKEGSRKKKAPMNCISCGVCRSVCPVGLDPEEIFKRIKINAVAERADECHGCGCCEVVCPSHLPLSSSIRINAVRGN